MTVGRFAPTPSGRMHLGNALCALLAYLSARKAGGEFVLRIEDLDAARCAFGNNAEILKEDLLWLGIRYDRGAEPENYQSRRFSIYENYVRMLAGKRLLYPCYCSRAELHAATAPHGRDGIPLYDGHCRILYDSGKLLAPPGRKPAYRLRVPDRIVGFTDGLQGYYSENLARDAGDFVIRRSDGVYAYHLAVVIDDALAGVTEVVRGRDLLSSTPRQIYLGEMCGFAPPRYYHIPLLTMPDGRRLSKRDGDLDIGAFRTALSSAEPLLGLLGFHAGLLDRAEAVTMPELISVFSWDKVPRKDIPLSHESVRRLLTDI